MEASNFGTRSRCIIILLHAVHDCPGGRTAAIVCHVSFAQITCFPTVAPLCENLQSSLNFCAVAVVVIRY